MFTFSAVVVVIVFLCKNLCRSTAEKVGLGLRLVLGWYVRSNKSRVALLCFPSPLDRWGRRKTGSVGRREVKEKMVR
jgi:hypothetical protein